MRVTEAKQRLRKLRELKNATAIAQEACANVVALAKELTEDEAPLPAELRSQIVQLLKTHNGYGMSISNLAKATSTNSVKIRWALRQLRSEGLVMMRGTSRGASYCFIHR